MKEIIQENKVPLIVGTLALIAVLIYVYQNKLAEFFLYRGETSKGAVNTGAVSNTVSNPSNNSNTATTMTNDTVLKKGDQGTKVGELQDLINKGLVKSNMAYATLVVDKNFGAKTENALYLLTGKRSISINAFKPLLA
jgi:hypothetical protein